MMSYNRGYINQPCVKRVRCPVCKCGIVFNGRISGDEKKIEIPAHGPTLEMSCKGAGWHKIKSK
jgi:hypothetical protein